MQVSTQSLHRLHHRDGFGFDDRLHNQLPCTGHHHDRNRFFVNIHPIYLTLSIVGAPFGNVLTDTQNLPQKGRLL